MSSTKPKQKFMSMTQFSGSDITEEQRVFLLACDKKQRLLKKRSLDSREILEVAKSLGYRKVTPVKGNACQPAA